MALPVYLDHNATTPCDPQVVAAMLPFFTEQFGNAASRHHPFGRAAADAVDTAREQVASLLGAEPGEVVFTSGATEAVNLAIKGVVQAYATKGRHVVTCATEHKAVLDTCAFLEKQGVDVTYLPVNSQGQPSIEELEVAICPDTVLVCLHYANNETGTVLPVAEIGAIARQKGALFFTDATQAVGKLPVNVNADNIDLLALSAHKFYGPKGVGALYVRRKDPRVRLLPLLHGGGHERGHRSGTLNVPGIVGLGETAAFCAERMETDRRHTEALRDQLESALLSIEGCAVNGDTVHRLPGTTNLRFAGVDSAGLLLAVARDVALSTGSACTSGSLEPSHVLKALGLTDEEAFSSVRLGVGRFTTLAEVDRAVTALHRAVADLRAANPFWQPAGAKR